MNDHQLFGWRVHSALPLPDLLPWRGDDRAPDITIEVGPAPPPIPSLAYFSPAVQISPAGVLVAIPAVATYWVEAGRRVIVQPHMREDAADIRLFLTGTILAVLCFQRGLVPLHASAVDIGGRALLLSGHSGAGKSTLAAAFSARGYRLLSDDLCALQIDDSATPMIYPAFPRLRLWKDSAEHLRFAAGLERSRVDLDKFEVPLEPAQFQSNPLPAAQVVLLRTERVRERRQVRLLGGLEALQRYDLVHRWKLGLALGQEARIFRGMARLMESAPVVEVARSEDFADLPGLVDQILAQLDAPCP